MRLTTFSLAFLLAAASTADRPVPPDTYVTQRPSRTRPRSRTVRRPQQAAKVALPDGEKLFVAYNCADCHGAGGSGLMAPSLADNRWRYGGAADDLYRSIAEGRPEGMPRWRTVIPDSHIRRLVAYVQTLGVGKDVTTMNFTGARVQRTGH